MNSQVLIDREVLEKWQKEALDWKIDSIAVGIMHALAPAPAPTTDAGEVVEVVGFLIGGELSKAACPVRGVHNEPLMTVAQHARIVSALQASAMVVQDVELLRRMQVCLSLDDTEWGLSAPEKYKLLGDIKTFLLAASPAPGDSK